LGQLSATARADCAASGDVAAPAPIDNYQFDIHIDTTASGLRNAFAVLVQDYLLTPLWMALVWVTDVLLVAIEWCYSLNLLGTGTLAPIVGGLDTLRRVMTTPWLEAVLAIAAVTFVYNGLIRRRVVETLGQFALMIAMMAGGLWVIVDPADTVGAVSQLANQASLGVLAASATGDPNQPARSLTDSLDQLFESAVGTPWCYLEFGNVAWCADPGQFDPDLRATALQIAALDKSGSVGPIASSEAQQEAVGIVGARTNGALFLALPANGPGRNSINADPLDPSLLNTLCGSIIATSCPAPTGPQAEFRTQQGTLARIGGLLLITAGDLGMFGFLGFLALRLLSAALLSLLYLLLAPLAVLAPALGDGGRSLFRLWSLRLLGSVLSKLIYSVFLGVVLLMLRILEELGTLGWWTQWLLIASFWWIVFNHRHQLLEHVIHERGESTRRASLGSRLFAAHQAIRFAAPIVKAAAGGARAIEERIRDIPVPRPRAPKPPADRRTDLDQQVSRTLERDHAQAVATVADAPAREAELTALRDRRDLLAREHDKATLSGDRRRAVSLELRAQEVATRIRTGEQELSQARTTVRRGEENTRQTGRVHDADQRKRQAELFDREAGLRPRIAARRDRRRGRRDYAELGPLAGVQRSDFAALPGPQRRRVQLEIDRALERRRAWSRETRSADRERRRAAAKATRRGERPQDRPPPIRVDPRRRQFGVTGDQRVDQPPPGPRERDGDRGRERHPDRDRNREDRNREGRDREGRDREGRDREGRNRDDRDRSGRSSRRVS
jgi:hypothetical protein